MRDPFRKFNSGRAVLFLVAIIALFITGAVLKMTAGIFLPFIIALLLALVMTPMVNFLEKIKVPRFISIISSGLIVIAVLLVMGVIFFNSARAILRVYPRYEARMTEIYIWLGQFFDLPYDEQLSFIQNLWGQLGIRTQIQLYTFTLSSTFIAFIRDVVMVALFLVFLLFEATFIKEKLSVSFENKCAGHIQKMSIDIMQQVSRYLSVKFIISVINGVLVAFFLRLIGVEFAAVWGIIQGILNFIPTLGSIAIGVVVSLYSVIQFWPEPGPIILTIITMLGVNMILGNIIDPKVMGDSLGLSPITILLSLFVWGFIWGFAGMVIAVPMMVIIKIVCENIPVLESISIILGSRRSVLAKKAQYEKEAEDEKVKVDHRKPEKPTE
jgi:predicted PurR-regulated permease PerM